MKSIFIIAFILFGSLVGQECETYTGDLNNDGEHNILDLLLLFNHILELESLDSLHFSNADFDCDSLLTVMDIEPFCDEAILSGQTEDRPDSVHFSINSDYFYSDDEAYSVDMFIDNPVNFRAIQFDLVLDDPQDLEIHRLDLSPSLSDYAVLVTYNQIDEHTLRVIVPSLECDEMENLSNVLLTIQFQGAFFNTITMCIENIIIQQDNVEIPSSGGCGEYQFIWVDNWCFEPGDINSDGIIDILDLVAIVEFIVTGESGHDFIFCGDVNNDQTLDILDILQIVQIILN
ncbi:MAG: hypothetical protein HQ510_03540 [Candidatus Marinimicrobia bacterium]|nr:hypothetical protein [Candidatus Neomarinimicrobiota bacterium]